MCNVRKVIRVFIAQFRQEFWCVRTVLIFLIMGIFIYSSLEPVAAMVHKVHIYAAPGAFVHIMNDYVCQIILAMGMFFLYSTAPFRRNSFPYIVYRCGQRNWEWGNILYMCILSFLYTLFILFVSVAALKGEQDFHIQGWGKIWGTLARTNAPDVFGIKLNVSDYLVGKYEPKFAMPATFFLTWAGFFFVGLAMYIFNLHIKKGSGIIFAGFLVFLDTMIYNSWTPWAYRISPLTLAKLTTFTNYHRYYGLTLTYAWIFLITGILIMCFMIFTLAGRKEKGYE